MKFLLKQFLKTVGLLFVFFLFSCAINSSHNYSKEFEYNEYYHYHNCLDEDCDVVDELIPHEYGEFEVIKEPSCYEKGEQSRICLVCGYQQKLDIDSHHKMVKVLNKKESCTEDGIKLHYKCEECGFLSYDKNGTLPCTLEELTISKLGHDYSDAQIEIINQTDNLEGQINVKCNRCNQIESILIPSFNDLSYYDVQTIDSTCEEEGKEIYTLKKELIKDRFIEKIGNDIQFNLVETQLISKEEIIEKEPHDYAFYIRFPTYKETGSTYFECVNCKKFKLNKKGYDIVYHFGKYDKNNDFITEISNEATCINEGKIEYILSKEFIYERLLDTYDMTIEELSPYVENADLTFSFVDKDPSHHYVEKYNFNNEGYLTYYLECQYHKDEYLYHNSWGIYYSTIPLNSDYVESTSTYLSCVENGYTKYKVDKEKIYKKIKDDLQINDNEISQYVNLVDLESIISRNHEPLGHSYGTNSIVLTYPTDFTFGLLQVCCNRENCKEYLKTISEDDKITLPKVSSEISDYTITETYEHCTEKGHVNYSISLSYLKQLALSHYGEDFDVTIFNKDANLNLNSSYEIEPLGHVVDRVPKYGTYSEDVRFVCLYCDETLVSILKPEYSEETYDKQVISGNCSSKTYSINRLKFEKSLEIISSYPIFYNQPYSLENYARQFSSATVFYEYGDFVPNVHGGKMDIYTGSEYNNTKPTYNVTTGIKTEGKYYFACSCGNYIDSQTFDYSSGYYKYNTYTGKFSKLFYIEKYNTYIYGDDRDSFTISIDLNGGHTSKITEASYGKNSSGSFTYIINKGEFSKGGKTIDYISVYIDGTYYSDEQLINEGRMSYIYNANIHTGYSIRMWKDASGNPSLTGDVRVVLHYKM